MLLIEQLQAETFPPGEQLLVDYILEHTEDIHQLSASALAQLTHTNPTSLVRIAKKLGYVGWSDLKEALREEWLYLNSHFTAVDANQPFTATDSPLRIASKIASLEQNTIQDTLSLLEPSDLAQAQHFLTEAQEIIVFAGHSNGMVAREFVSRMRRIGFKIILTDIYDYSYYEAYHSNPDTCAIIISYSGENLHFVECLDILKQNGAKTISLTSIGANSISTRADCSLKITTREKLYSKIANFTSSTSIIYLLNVLYALAFTVRYETNLAHIQRTGRRFDQRVSTVRLIQEDE
ncbi:sugar isomerase [Suicoccus acidiformans]|uniref:Sugar isomerase n=1 Tax=Suicoccus acidiformans TaxID=2036206 RepID=A0A347WI09_9LACT|nr:MurR/RpiR family transcriptional regulator [Suicoccus acidiformans]AXY24716.1 sugar isomerase [Suicoccus acidiformans]